MSPPSRDPSSEGGNTWQKTLREVAPYLDLGWRVAISIVLFTVGGYYLDQWWGTMPWLTVVGALCGMGMVFIQIFQLSGTFGADEPSGTSPRAPDEEDRR